MNDDNLDSAGNRRLAAILLAAGPSSRLGQPKQLLKQSNVSLFDKVLELSAREVDIRPIVVLGALPDLHVPDGFHRVVNEGWESGMGSSIRAGLAELDGTAGGVMLMTVDQFRLTHDDIFKLAKAWRKQPEQAVAARYGHATGIPVIFPRSSFSQLAKCDDSGAKSILRSLNPLQVDMPAAGYDLDTPADLDLFRRIGIPDAEA